MHFADRIRVRYAAVPWPAESHPVVTRDPVRPDLRAAYRLQRSLCMTRVDAAMTREVVWIEPTDDLQLAHGLMTGLSIRHLPVVHAGKLVGILSDRDVRTFGSVRDGFLHVPTLPVSEAMTRDVVTCAPNATISDVGRKMLGIKIDCIPIVTPAGTLTGLVTSSDLIQLLVDREDALSEPLPFEFTLRDAAWARRAANPDAA